MHVVKKSLFTDVPRFAARRGDGLTPGKETISPFPTQTSHGTARFRITITAMAFNKRKSFHFMGTSCRFRRMSFHDGTVSLPQRKENPLSFPVILFNVDPSRSRHKNDPLLEPPRIPQGETAGRGRGIRPKEGSASLNRHLLDPDSWRDGEGSVIRP